ncbi:MAG: LCP family protein [Synergistaceae bacterium]|nr:LCP family protein [Synergistaceae bacterium]
MKRSAIRKIFLVIILGIFALTAGAGLRIYLAWNTKGDDLINIAKKDAENSDSDSYEALESQGKFNILLMGEDDVEGSRRSDTILFITVDIDDKNIRVMSMPRDTRVQIPAHGAQKLNHAFAYGGADLLRATVSKYLNEPILYYVVVDYNSFPEFVDMLGGVDIDVQKRMRYVDRAGKLDINIKAGPQTLDGKTALHFVRFRKDALGDIGRIQRQQQFIKAMLKKAYDPRVIIKFPELAAQAMKIFRTDMSNTFALQLAGFIQNEVGRERVFFTTLPGEAAIIDRLSYWMGDVKSARAFINASLEELMDGGARAGAGGAAYSSALDPDEQLKLDEEQSGDAQQAEQRGSSSAQNGMTKDELLAIVKSIPDSMAVLNGTGKNGVAAEISTKLQQLGVDVVHTGNAKHSDYRHCNIVYPTGASASVKETARIMGSLLKIPGNLVRPSQQAFYASLIAGHDYKKIVTLLDELIKTGSTNN